MAVPAAPTGLSVVGKPGLLQAAWSAPAGTVWGYYIDYSTSNLFTTSSSRESLLPYKTIPVSDADILTPGGSYYVRVRAYNGDGTGPYSSVVGLTQVPPRTSLDAIRGASVQVDGHQVEIRSDGANSMPTLTLGVVPMGVAAGDSTFTTIEVLPRGAGQFDSGYGSRAYSIAVAPDGDLFVLGPSATLSRNIAVRKYNRTGPTTWAAVGTLICTLPNWGPENELVSHIAAAYSPSTQKPSIFAVYRRSGLTTWPGSFGSVTLNPESFVTGDPLVFDITDGPSWMSTPGAGAGANQMGVDLDRLQYNGDTMSTFAVASNGHATVTVTNGVIAGIAKASSGTALGISSFKRVLAINYNSFAIVYDDALGVRIDIFDRNCTFISTRSIAKANFQGASSIDFWGAWYDARQGAINVDYLTESVTVRELERFQWFINTDVVVTTQLTNALGASGGSQAIRAVVGAADERRVIIEGAFLLTGTKSTVLFADRSSNVAPGAPSLTDKVQFDATAAQVFAWAFSDPNLGDTQRAYELEIQRVSDSVNVVDIAKTVSAAQTYTVNAAVLANNVNYRWRVMTYDASDVASAWSAYDTFSTAAVGTLTITTPSADDLAGFMTSSVALNWTYTQPNGYVQTKRRIRVIRDADGVVLSDTTLQASVMNGETVTGIPTDERVRIELTIENNAPVPVTVTRTRYLTSSYSLPVAPTIDVEDPIGDGGYIRVLVYNSPGPGDRPDTSFNIIQRRPLGAPADAWASIGVTDGAGSPIAYDDYTALTRGQYEYRAIAVGGGAENASSAFAATNGSIIGAWVHDVADPEGSAQNHVYTTGARKENISRDSTSNTMVGRRRPVIDYGEAEGHAVSVTFEVPFSSTYDAEVKWWAEAALAGATLFYRDNRGRGFYTTLDKGVQLTETRSGMLVAITITEIDYEVVV